MDTGLAISLTVAAVCVVLIGVWLFALARTAGREMPQMDSQMERLPVEDIERLKAERRVRFATDDALADHRDRGCEYCRDAQRKAWPT